jgi:TM2 domain-containing membrane protein YozV
MNENKTEKRILPAFLLCTFLGHFGAHRFYAGKIGTAITMLILTLTLVGIVVSSIWAFIDWILVLTGNFRDKEGNKITQWT